MELYSPRTHLDTHAGLVAVTLRCELECIPVVLPQTNEFYSGNKGSGKQMHKFFGGLFPFTHVSLFLLRESFHFFVCHSLPYST